WGAERPQGLSRRSWRGILLSARRRHGPEDDAGRTPSRRADPRRRDTPAAAPRTALSATPRRYGGAGNRAPAKARRARRFPMVLRELRPPVVPGVLRADRHREAVPSPVRAFLCERRAAHLRELRHSDGAGALKARIQLPGGAE